MPEKNTLLPTTITLRWLGGDFLPGSEDNYDDALVISSLIDKSKPRALRDPLAPTQRLKHPQRFSFEDIENDPQSEITTQHGGIINPNEEETNPEENLERDEGSKNYARHQSGATEITRQHKSNYTSRANRNEPQQPIVATGNIWYGLPPIVADNCPIDHDAVAPITPSLHDVDNNGNKTYIGHGYYQGQNGQLYFNKGNTNLYGIALLTPVDTIETPNNERQDLQLIPLENVANGNIAPCSTRIPSLEPGTLHVTAEGGRSFYCTVTREWRDMRDQRTSRSDAPSQYKVMNNRGAKTVAIEHGIILATSDVRYEHCHLIPWKDLGIPAQVMINLFPGPEAVNTWMIVSEQITEYLFDNALYTYDEIRSHIRLIYNDEGTLCLSMEVQAGSTETNDEITIFSSCEPLNVVTTPDAALIDAVFAKIDIQLNKIINLKSRTTNNAEENNPASNTNSSRKLNPLAKEFKINPLTNSKLNVLAKEFTYQPNLATSGAPSTTGHFACAGATMDPQVQTPPAKPTLTRQDSGG